MDPEAFRRWLRNITPTKPFTTGDAAELYAMIHTALTAWPDTVVDINCPRGDKVYVRVENYKGVLAQEVLDVV